MSALDVQVGGSHYKDKAIQPIEFIHANKLGFIEGSIVKYITRWREKGGVKDLEKIKHYVDLLIELEQKAKPKVTAPPGGQPVPSKSLEDIIKEVKRPGYPPVMNVPVQPYPHRNDIMYTVTATGKQTDPDWSAS